MIIIIIILHYACLKCGAHLKQNLRQTFEYRWWLGEALRSSTVREWEGQDEADRSCPVTQPVPQLFSWELWSWMAFQSGLILGQGDWAFFSSHCKTSYWKCATSQWGVVTFGEALSLTESSLLRATCLWADSCQHSLGSCRMSISVACQSFRQFPGDTSQNLLQSYCEHEIS